MRPYSARVQLFSDYAYVTEYHHNCYVTGYKASGIMAIAQLEAHRGYGIASTDAGGVSHPGTSTCLDKIYWAAGMVV